MRKIRFLAAALDARTLAISGCVNFDAESTIYPAGASSDPELQTQRALTQSSADILTQRSPLT